LSDNPTYDELLKFCGRVARFLKTDEGEEDPGIPYDEAIDEAREICARVQP